MGGFLRQDQSWLADSSRWDGFEFRAGDIVISTPSKCGTTWMQMICALLIFGDANLPRPLTELSPWLDIQTDTISNVFAALAAQRHRRFIKSHTPYDGLPHDDRVTYTPRQWKPIPNSVNLWGGQLPNWRKTSQEK